MIDVIVLSGGKGSRSENPLIPKSLQHISAGVRVIDTINRSISTLPINRVIVVLGEHSILQSTAFSELSWGAPIVYTESLGLGTSAAVRKGSEHATEEYCLIVLADCAISAPLNGYLEDLVINDFDGLVLCRYSDHPDDSDTLELARDGLVENLVPKGMSASLSKPFPQISLSGALFVRREVLRELPVGGDFQTALIQIVRKRNLRVKGRLTRFFLRDTGTPKRIMRVRESFESGALERRGKALAPAVFIDRDGTLIPDIGDDRKIIESDDIPLQVISQLRNLNILGIPWFIVTNQPGVAKGKLSIEEVGGTFLQIQKILAKDEAFFDDFRFCPHHPESGWEGEVPELKVECSCRKPATGMVDSLALEHGLNLSASWIIGDSDADNQLARQVGCKYIGIKRNDSHALAKALREAAREIVNAS